MKHEVTDEQIQYSLNILRSAFMELNADFVEKFNNKKQFSCTSLGEEYKYIYNKLFKVLQKDFVIQKLHDLTLGDRIYVCSECGNMMDRDYNASVNLENYGLSTLSLRGIKACGESVRLRDACGQGAVSAKQEGNIGC
jgi:hypothetical protein